MSSGFALAALPITDTVLATGSEGLEAGDVKIATATGDIPGYRARPAGDPERKAPVLLVVHEIFGVHEHIKDLCRRFAKHGYFAIAPDLFFRHGDATQLTDIKQVREIANKASDAQVAGDLDATVAWAGRQPGADATRLAITGYCWGGRVTWLYAAHQPLLKAGVAWYGRVVGDADPLHPKHPIDVVGDLKAPVLGLYGGKDQGISLESVAQMKSALSASKNAAAKQSAFHVYPEAGHAFAADYRPSYRKDDAEDGFKRLYGWLKQHGVG